MNIEQQYLELLKDILENGIQKKDRTGTGTISVFGRQIRHKMSEGFPLLTTKKMYFKGIVTELLWFLKGDTNIKYLVDNDCHIWDGDAYKNYEKKTPQQHVIINDSDLLKDSMICRGKHDHMSVYPISERFIKEEFINKIKSDNNFAKKWGNLGPIYGAQWRKWERYGYRNVQNGALDCGLISKEDLDKEMHIDQIANLINDIKTNPDSRRLMVSAWNPADLDQMALPPCHYGFQIYTRELTIQERENIFRKEFNGLQYMLFSLEGEEGLHKEYDKQNIPRRSISLMWSQRSIDTILGLPFNIASYALLLEILAKEVNMIPDELIGNLGDTHLYLNHIGQAKEQITRNPYKLPNLQIEKEVKRSENECLPSYSISDFKINNYISHTSIKAPLSN